MGTESVSARIQVECSRKWRRARRSLYTVYTVGNVEIDKNLSYMMNGMIDHGPNNSG